MALTSRNQRRTARAEKLNAQDFIAPADVLMQRNDGSGVDVLVAGRGTRIPYSRARQMGLIKADGTPVEVDENGRVEGTEYRMPNLRLDLGNTTTISTSAELVKQDAVSKQLKKGTQGVNLPDPADGGAASTARTDNAPGARTIREGEAEKAVSERKESGGGKKSSAKDDEKK